MPEQLRFEQALWQARAVDRHHRPTASMAGPMQRLGNQLLAGSRLAEQQHRCLRGSDTIDQREHALKRRRAPDHSLWTSRRLSQRKTLHTLDEIARFARRITDRHQLDTDIGVAFVGVMQMQHRSRLPDNFAAAKGQDSPA